MQGCLMPRILIVTARPGDLDPAAEIDIVDIDTPSSTEISSIVDTTECQQAITV